jgi:hypothetical protein
MSHESEYHPTPRVVVAAAYELLQKLWKRAATLAIIPEGAQGGFLQPPHQSHFGPK